MKNLKTFCFLILISQIKIKNNQIKLKTKY